MNREQTEFLQSFKIEGKIDGNAIPIFADEGDSIPEFLKGYACTTGDERRRFIAEAPEGLWLGGGAVVVLVPQGVVSIPDRRHGGNLGPTAQGWAKYDEGADLSLSAAREYGEELVLYVLGGEGDNLYQSCTEIVPLGVEPKGRAETLNINLDNVQAYGNLEFLSWVQNRLDRALIYTSLWDLRELPQVHRLRIVWNDDFPKGLRPGTNPRVIDLATGLSVGAFEGAQGYVPNDAQFHPALDAAMMELKKV